jgi:hypothetical protein
MKSGKLSIPVRPVMSGAHNVCGAHKETLTVKTLWEWAGSVLTMPKASYVEQLASEGIQASFSIIVLLPLSAFL